MADITLVFAVVAIIIVLGFGGELFFKKTGIPSFLFHICRHSSWACSQHRVRTATRACDGSDCNSDSDNGDLLQRNGHPHQNDFHRGRNALLFVLLAFRTIAANLSRRNSELRTSRFIITLMCAQGLTPATLAIIVLNDGIPLAPVFLNIVTYVIILTNIVTTFGSFWFARRWKEPITVQLEPSLVPKVAMVRRMVVRRQTDRHLLKGPSRNDVKLLWPLEIGPGTMRIWGQFTALIQRFTSRKRRRCVCQIPELLPCVLRYHSETP